MGALAYTKGNDIKSEELHFLLAWIYEIPFLPPWWFPLSTLNLTASNLNLVFRFGVCLFINLYLSFESGLCIYDSMIHIRTKYYIIKFGNYRYSDYKYWQNLSNARKIYIPHNGHWHSQLNLDKFPLFFILSYGGFPNIINISFNFFFLTKYTLFIPPTVFLALIVFIMFFFALLPSFSFLKVCCIHFFLFFSPCERYHFELHDDEKEKMQQNSLVVPLKKKIQISY